MDDLNFADSGASAKASTFAFSANADPSSSYMKCNYLATRNLSSHHRCIEEKIPEIPTLGSTTYISQDEKRETSYIPYLMLSEKFYDSCGTITNQQNTCMEMDNTRLLRLATSHSEKHVQWPARSTPDDLSWTSLNNITKSRYPSNLGVKIKRVDANINAHYTGTRKESEILVENTTFIGRDLSVAVPNKETLKRSIIYEEEFEHSRYSSLFNPNKTSTVIDHQGSSEVSYLRSKNVHVPVERLVVEPTKKIYEATRIPSRIHVQAAKDEQESNPTAQNDIHQKLRTLQNVKARVTTVRRNSKEMSVEQLHSIEFLNEKDAMSSSCTSTSEENINTMPKSKAPELSSELCSYRAARGCAVHPRSIAERVRRSRIAERVKILEAKLPYPTKKRESVDYTQMKY